MKEKRGGLIMDVGIVLIFLVAIIAMCFEAILDYMSSRKSK
jgi:hypothetical protein